MATGAGLLTTAAFPPVAWWFLTPVGVGLLGLVTRERSSGRGALLGLVFGVAFFAPLLHFTAVAMGNVIGWVALTFVESLYLAVLGGAWALTSRLTRLRECAPLRACAFALLWTAVEEVRSTWPLGGFPFGRLAWAMADSTALPVASWVGSVGLTLLVAVVGALSVEGAEGAVAVRRLRPLSGLAMLVTAGLLVVAPVAVPLPTRADDGTLRVGAVQGNVAEDFEDAFGRALEVTTNHVEATDQLTSAVGPGGVDVVVWPENAADLDPRRYPAVAGLVDGAAQSIGAPVVVGAVLYEDGVRYNDMIVWTPGQGAGEYYRKHHPVPFAEYVPARSLVRKVTTQVDRIGTDMAAGTGPSTLTVHAARQDRDVRLAMGICFEVAYDSALRAGVEQGGEVIVIPTNNASFLHSSEAAQQLEQGRVQAVVHGRAVVQVSTVGITAVITPDGSVAQATEPYTQAALVADVPLRTQTTVADRLGAWPAVVLQAGAGTLLLAGMVSRARRAHAARRRSTRSSKRR